MKNNKLPENSFSSSNTNFHSFFSLSSRIDFGAKNYCAHHRRMFSMLKKDQMDMLQRDSTQQEGVDKSRTVLILPIFSELLVRDDVSIKFRVSVQIGKFIQNLPTKEGKRRLNFAVAFEIFELDEGVRNKHRAAFNYLINNIKTYAVQEKLELEFGCLIVCETSNHQKTMLWKHMNPDKPKEEKKVCEESQIYTDPNKTTIKDTAAEKISRFTQSINTGAEVNLEARVGYWKPPLPSLITIPVALSSCSNENENENDSASEEVGVSSSSSSSSSSSNTHYAVNGNGADVSLSSDAVPPPVNANAVNLPPPRLPFGGLSAPPLSPFPVSSMLNNSATHSLFNVSGSLIAPSLFLPPSNFFNSNLVSPNLATNYLNYLNYFNYLQLNCSNVLSSSPSVLGAHPRVATATPTIANNDHNASKNVENGKNSKHERNSSGTRNPNAFFNDNNKRVRSANDKNAPSNAL